MAKHTGLEKVGSPESVLPVLALRRAHSFLLKALETLGF
jgi:hypothetical protein